jgi:hypothetical protein
MKLELLLFEDEIIEKESCPTVKNNTFDVWKKKKNLFEFVLDVKVRHMNC